MLASYRVLQTYTEEEGPQFVVINFSTCSGN